METMSSDGGDLWGGPSKLPCAVQSGHMPRASKGCHCPANGWESRGRVLMLNPEWCGGSPRKKLSENSCGRKERQKKKIWGSQNINVKLFLREPNSGKVLMRPKCVKAGSIASRSCEFLLRIFSRLFEQTEQSTSIGGRPADIEQQHNHQS